MLSKLPSALTNIISIISNLSDGDGDLFLDYTSQDIVNGVHEAMVAKIFLHAVPYDFFDAMTDGIFYDVFLDEDDDDHNNIGPKSEFYWRHAHTSFKTYVESGILFRVLKEGLDRMDDEYADYIYQRFGFEDFFYKAFNETFAAVYYLVRGIAVVELETLDMNEVVTKYMR